MKPEMKCGIYGILNTENGKWYIGQSVDIFTRWNCHKTNIKYNNYLNEWFKKDRDIYPANVFEYVILEECASDMLTIREKAWIEYHKSNKQAFGYNKTPAIDSWMTVKRREAPDKG